MESNEVTVTKLKDVIEYAIGGDWGKNEDFSDNDYTKVLVLRGTEFTKWNNTNIETAVTRKIKTSSLKKRMLRAGDIVIEISGGGPNQPVGRTILITQELINKASTPLICSNFCRLVRFNNSVHSNYIQDYLSYIYVTGEINNYQTSSTNLRNLNFNKLLEDVDIPIPSKAKQQTISRKIQIVNSRKVELDSHISNVNERLKLFKQATFHAAVTGKLTESWRVKNTKVSAVNVPSPQDDSFDYEFGDIPETWKYTNLQQIGELARGKSKHRPRNDPKLFGGRYPFIQTGDVANSGGIINSYVQTYNQQGLEQSRLFPKNTLCITIAANISDVGILGIDACFPDSIVGFIPSIPCKIEYFYYYFSVIKGYLERIAPETAQKNINLGILRRIKVPIPPLDEQTEIVKRVNHLLDFDKRVKTSVKVTEHKSNLLTQSVLNKTFKSNED